MKVGLFYGSTTGNTARVAKLIRKALGNVVSICKNIKDATPAEFAGCDGLILGVSTWEEGQMQEHFRDFLPEIAKMDLNGKTVALFGLGDQQGYSGRFVDALGTLYHAVKQRGASIVGRWPTEEYHYATSTAIVDGEFVGLAIDEETQKKLTGARVNAWAALIRPFFQ